MRSGAFAAAVLALAGCAATPAGAPAVAPEFQGFWTNVDPKTANWWEITADRVVNYGGFNGGCRHASATILAADLIDIRFGNAGTVRMRLTGDRLVFDGALGIAHHRRVPRTSICRRDDGTYLQDAPYKP